MTRTSFELFIHPIRLRILALLQRRQLTVAELRVALPDVPQRTIYRQLEELVAGGLIVVAETRRVRGTLEQRFQLARQPVLTPEERREVGPEDWEQLFAAAASLLIAEFTAFARAQDDVASSPPLHYFRLGEIVATPDQIAELLQQTIERADALTTAADAQGRRYRISLISFPLEGVGEPTDEQ